MKITYQDTLELMVKGSLGAVTRATAETLGLKYPLASGWRQLLVGREVSDELWARAIELKTMSAKEWRALTKNAKVPAPYPVPTVHELLSRIERQAMDIAELKTEIQRIRVLIADIHTELEAADCVEAFEEKAGVTQPITTIQSDGTTPWKE